jgi:hypothetical protein
VHGGRAAAIRCGRGARGRGRLETNQRKAWSSMARRPKEPNDRLQDLIQEAGFSHKGLARRINDLGRTRGIPGLCYDHSSVIRWLKGEQPRDPAPKLAAEVFSLTLARPITETDLGFPKARELPELGLRFTPSLRDTIETVTTLWRSDVERRQFILNSAFAAGVYASSAIRWLTAPAVPGMPAAGQGVRAGRCRGHPRGHADVPAAGQPVRRRPGPAHSRPLPA